MKIPYHGRRSVKKPTAQQLEPIFKKMHPEGQDGAEEAFPGQYGDPASEIQEKVSAYLADLGKHGWESLFVDENTIRFGSTDLVLSGDLSNCSSQLEQSYGFGMSSADARTLLAGGETFKIQELEVFIVGHPEETQGHHFDGSIPSPPQEDYHGNEMW